MNIHVPYPASSSSSSKTKEHPQPQKKKRPAEELVDRVFRKVIFFFCPCTNTIQGTEFVLLTTDFGRVSFCFQMCQNLQFLKLFLSPIIFEDDESDLSRGVSHNDHDAHCFV